ncbi:MAG TPA: RidA family protein [Puia sp.]|uniref:RidA family protein n=1 Tax=Puia sp. TaxID=2045100 RepID=UPI002C61E912|nr:RidA family protein [Puia sp.]HVU96281.1 RidA family protein [Puia sp.]
MEKQRRSALKKLLLAMGGALGIGTLAKAESVAAAPAAKPAAPAEKEAINVVMDQEVPLFSQITKFNGMVFIAGQGAHVEPFEIKAHTEIVLKGLEKQLIAAGSSMEKVLKVHVYLNDIADYAGMNEVFKGRFGAKPPVRTTVAVAKGGVPGNSLVEMDCIAYV